MHFKFYYQLDFSQHARSAGNTVSQSAYSKVEGGGSVKVVFYASQERLTNEQQLYKNAALAPLLPQCLHCCASGQAHGRSAAGYPQRNFLPPFVILEESETLHEVLNRASPTFQRSVKVCSTTGTQFSFVTNELSG